MIYKCQNPILLITFIKFDTAFEVLEKIKETTPEKLYISSDGGRTQKEHQKILAFRKELLSRIDWECEVFTLFDEKNNGCKYGPYNAISWFFSHEEQGIILEDDCLPNNSFFRFCDELLEKYKNNEAIFLISGLNFCEDFTKTLNVSYTFSKISHTNGWASWSRAWNGVAMEHKDFNHSFADISAKLFHSNHEKKYWKKFFKQWQTYGFNQAWDYQWLFHIWANRGLGIYPSINMIRNIGLDHINATHQIFDKYFLSLKEKSMIFPLKHPEKIQRCIELEKEDYKIAFKVPSFKERIKNTILGKFKRFFRS